MLPVVAVLAAAPAGAHEILYEVATGAAVVVQLHDADGDAFAFEPYELYPRDADRPAQIGKSDAAGRVVFLPGDVRQWRLKAYSEDGHGLDVRFTAEGGAAAVPVVGSRAGRNQWIVTGVALLFGLFGLMQLFLGRARRR